MSHGLKLSGESTIDAASLRSDYSINSDIKSSISSLEWVWSSLIVAIVTKG